MLNKVFLHGRLANIPELRKTQSGKSVCTFTIAVSRDSKSPETDFITCVAWEGRAEFVCQYFTKGQEALVTGSLNNRSYTDRDGNKRTVSEVLVAGIDFCGKKNAANDRGGNERRPEMVNQEPFEDLGGDDGDLPF